MTNANETLMEVAPPSGSSPAEFLEWCKNTFVHTADMCREAMGYWEAMRKHHANIADLMARLHELDRDRPIGWEDETRETVEVVSEIVDAMRSLREDHFSKPDDVLDLDHLADAFGVDVAEFILDLAGYTADKDLGAHALLEPSCGHGAFIVQAIDRLLRSAKRYDRAPRSLVRRHRGLRHRRGARRAFPRECERCALRRTE